METKSTPTPAALAVAVTSSQQSKRVAGVEAGGQSCLVSIADGSPFNVVAKKRFETSTPDATISAIKEFLVGAGRLDAIGLAWFGPVDLDPASDKYGYVTSTPKTAWQWANVVGPFRSLGVPVGFQTDVNPAALAEVKYGGHGAITSCCYVTVGTGVGVGVVVDGKPVSGLLHPEAGHIRLARHADDTFEGTCPYHGACLEGYISAGAIAKRCGCGIGDLHTIPDNHPVWNFTAYYLAQLCSTLLYVCSPQVIVLGGGILKRELLWPQIRKHFVSINNGYISHKKVIDQVDTYIVASRFNAEGSNTTAGAVGSLALAFETAANSNGASLQSKLPVVASTAPPKPVVDESKGGVKPAKSQLQCMLDGDFYDASDITLVNMRLRARMLIRQYNATSEGPHERIIRTDLLKLLLGSMPASDGSAGNVPFIEPSFRCDYGSNIHVGRNFYANFDLVVLDCARVTIGDDVMMGPRCQLITASHPLDPTLRCQLGLEDARPIIIGDRVWLGAGVIVCPGVKIGSNCVIGAGSVVTKDIAAGMVAVGVPARVIKPVPMKSGVEMARLPAHALAALAAEAAAEAASPVG